MQAEASRSVEAIESRLLSVSLGISSRHISLRTEPQLPDRYHTKGLAHRGNRVGKDVCRFPFYIEIRDS